MIITEESLKTSEEKHILEYNWFHPNRISYHIYRFFHSIFGRNNDEKEALVRGNDHLKLFDYLYDLIMLKYAFPYSRLLSLFTLHYIQSIKSFHLVNNIRVNRVSAPPPPPPVLRITSGAAAAAASN
jgi:hypothetical protein